MRPFGPRAGKNCFYGAASRRRGGIAQLVEQTAHIRSVIGPSPIAAKKDLVPQFRKAVFFSQITLMPARRLLPTALS